MSLGPWEIVLILLVIFLLFGATRLPNAARSLGRSMRIFKSEMNEMKSEDEARKAVSQTPQSATQADLQQQATNIAQPVQQQPQVQPQAKDQ